MDLSLDDLHVSLPDGSVRRDGVVIDTLTELEAALLSFLAARPGVEVSRDELHREVWGYADGVRSRAVDFTMSRLRKKVEADPSTPRFLHTIRGSGYRYLPGEPAPVPLRAAPPPDAFLGRSEELTRLSAAFEGGARLVTVLGLGGVGKTRLVLEWIRAQHLSLGDVVAVDLSAVTQRSTVLDVVGRHLGLPPGQGDPAQRIGARLGARGTLLLLDDVDRVVEDAADLAGQWLSEPGVRMLVTSRERLRIGGEHVLELAPLNNEAAADLFRARAEAVRGPLSPEELTMASRMVEHLAGWPLALELAAARTRLVPMATVLTSLDPLALTSRERDRPARHRSIGAVLDDTGAHLSTAETEALLALALLPHGASLDTLEQLLPHRDALDAVADLADRALVRLTEAHGEARVHLIGLIRRWVLDRAVADPRRSSLDERRRAWAAEHAGSIATLLRTGGGWRDPLDLERANLRAIWDSRSTINASAVKLGVALTGWWIVRGSWVDLPELAEQSLADATTLGDPELLNEARVVAANVARLTGSPAAAVEQCRALLASNPSDAIRGEATFLLGASLRRLGELEAAAQTLAPLADENHLSAARAGTVLALIYAARGQHEASVSAAKRALAQVNELKAEGYLSTMAVNLAVVLRLAKQLPEARQVLEQAKNTLAASGSARLTATLLHEQGTVEVEAGNLADGEHYQREELATLETWGDRAGTAWPLGNLAVVVAERGDLTEARALLHRALKIHRATGSRVGEAATRANLGIVDLLADEPDAAQTHLEEALALTEEQQLARYLPVMRAFLALSRGEPVPEVLDAPAQDLRLLHKLTAR